jgi:hypothetical protein
MNVNVLTSGYWPSYPHLEAKLPDELTRYQTVFKVLIHTARSSHFIETFSHSQTHVIPQD